jgi:hypothetical protein
MPLAVGKKRVDHWVFDQDARQGGQQRDLCWSGHPTYVAWTRLPTAYAVKGEQDHIDFDVLHEPQGEYVHVVLDQLLTLPAAAATAETPRVRVNSCHQLLAAGRLHDSRQL